MNYQLKQALILGAIVGIFLAAFMIYYSGGKWFWLFVIPVTALMAAGPIYLKPKDYDEDD